MVNEARKISQAQKEMYVAVNAMRTDIKKEALKHFQKAFSDEGFTDKSFWHWKPVKLEYRKRQYRNEKILKNTGRLKRGLKTFSNSTKEGFTVRFENNVKYVKVHNEGLRAGRGRGFKMPKRMFMGYSHVLNRKLENIFNARIKRIFK